MSIALKIREKLSYAHSVALLSESERRAWAESLSPAEAEQLVHSWGFWARPAQLSPWSPFRGADVRAEAMVCYRFWVFRAGRGSGKTRAAAETVIEEARALGAGARIALVARTAADVRDTMVELGDSSILGCSPPDFRPVYEPSKRRLTWPNGAIATTFTGDEPNQLRGPQHTFAWADEVASWKRPDTWDQLLFGLRLGEHPRAVVTSTPKRSSKILKTIEASPKTFTTRGTTYDNAAHLPPAFLEDVQRRYANTSLGRQELLGDELAEVDGALWKLSIIDPHRIEMPPARLSRVVIGVDPPGGRTECGIVAAGVERKPLGVEHGFVLEDASAAMGPDGWGRRVVQAYRDWKADAIVAEANFGGDMVEHVIRTVDPNARVIVVHASRGKALRAEPVVGLYEQGRIHHVGLFAELEAEMTGWVPTESRESPNRLDALVWALTDLILDGPTPIVPATDDSELDDELGWERDR